MPGVVTVYRGVMCGQFIASAKLEEKIDKGARFEEH